MISEKTLLTPETGLAVYSLSAGVKTYTHDCDGCVFLGDFLDEHTHHEDLYWCWQGGSPTLIARFGSDGPNYASLPIDLYDVATPSLAINEAHRRWKLYEPFRWKIGIQGLVEAHWDLTVRGQKVTEPALLEWAVDYGHRVRLNYDELRHLLHQPLNTLLLPETA